MTPAPAPRHLVRRRRWFTRRRAITFSLAVATAGQAIPYGTQGAVEGRGVVHLNAEEWALSGAAALAVVLLLVDLFLTHANPWRRQAWAFALTGFVWVTLAAYDAMFPGPTWQWHLGHALTDAGVALIALHQWRFIATGKEFRE